MAVRKVRLNSDVKTKEIARILVEHSCRIKKGEYVQIVAGIPARPLILELQKQILKKGAYPRVDIDFEGLSYTYYQYASEEQLKNFPKLRYDEMKQTDAIIYIGAPENRYELYSADPKKITLRSKIIKKIFDERLKKKWVIFDWPVRDFADDAGLSLSEFRKFVFDSCIQDWNKLTGMMDKVKRVLDKGNKVRIISNDTNLTFGIRGRLGAIGDGRHNMPDGEVWTAPEEDTEGHITFTYPLIFMGRKIEKIRLEFKKGKVVKASAKSNLNALDHLLKTDEGSRKLGELGIGCNFKIKRFSNLLLFDEKIGGTIHLALGNAYTECNGKNKSAVHADIVKDLRHPYSGEVWIDNKLLIKDGKLLV
ncbi:MAG: aminopeptidase [Nanoarchaeota archaeon]|nr:aminopeptidase [Nanoarchaeota archaeon]